MAVVSFGLPDHEGIDPMDGTSPASQITAAGALVSSVWESCTGHTCANLAYLSVILTV